MKANIQGDSMETNRIKPVLETKRHEIEVFVAYYEYGGNPFVAANVVGGTSFKPSGDYVERYVFEVKEPVDKIKSSKLKGQA